jgi:hypothetical protein
VSSSLADIQGGQVLTACVAGQGSGITEIEYSITFGAVGAPTLVTNRPDLVSGVVRNGAGDYTVTYARPFPSQVRTMEISYRNSGGAPRVPLAASPVSVTVDDFSTVDFAGAQADPNVGDGVHVLCRFRRDGGAF